MTSFVRTVGFLLSFSIATAWAQPEVDRTVREISLEVLSPFCPGRSLEDCPSEKAVQLKDEIRNKISSGRSKKDVIDELIQTYGNSMRAIPEAKGFGLLVWAIPSLFILIGAFFVVWNVRGKGEK